MNVFNHMACSGIGADDFYGPLCTVACYVSDQDILWLKDLHLENINFEDNEQIIKYGQILKDKLIYSLLIMDNSHYNQMIDEGLKMAQIKTFLCNQAMVNVIKRVDEPIKKKIVIPFLSPKKYYKHLKKKTLVVTHLTFTNDDNTYIGLKCAKILAKYAHFQYFRNMKQSLNIDLPHSCQMSAIECGLDLVHKHGIDILEKVSKKNLPNYKQILELLKASD